MKNEYLKKLKLAIDPFIASGNKLKKDLSEIFEISASRISQNIKDTMKDVTKDFSSAITNVFSNATNEMRNMLELSQLSSETTRKYAFGYGFSASEAYGWQKALEQVGLSSEEDLFYANQQELQQFREAFTKYSQKYDELYDSGFFETMQEYQYEMRDFKNEMSLEVAEFFMENKEVIKNGMKGMMLASETLLKIFDWLTKLFPGSSSSASSADIINQYNTTSSSKNTNVNVSNSFTGVAKSDERWLTDAGSLTYQQIITALGGN